MSILKLNLKQALVGFMTLLILISPSYSQAQTYTTNSLYQPRTQQELIAYLFGVIAQLQAQLQAEQMYSQTVYYTDDDYGYTDYSDNWDDDDDDRRSTRRSNSSYRDENPFFVNIITLAPTAISRTEATLKGEVDKGGSEYLDVWFEYGTNGDLTKRSKVEVVKYNYRQTVTATIDGLRNSTDYSYRIVSEDEDGNRQYGDIRSFDTISSASSQTFSGRPSAETEGARDISSSGAYLEGFVSMNDYDEGSVFFVYGRNRSDVSEIDDYDSYDDIGVYYDSGLGKTYASQNFDGRNTVKQSVYSLRNASKYYYRVCVEYDERNTRLECGQIESFTTLN